MFPNRQCIVLGLPHKIHIKLLQAVSNPAVLHETTVTHHAISGTDTPHQHIGHVGALNLTVSPCLCYTLCIALTRLRICRGAFRSDDLVVLTATFVTHRHAGLKLRSPCVPQSDYQEQDPVVPFLCLLFAGGRFRCHIHHCGQWRLFVAIRLALGIHCQQNSLRLTAE